MSEKLQRFIFEFLDSVELLEVLLLLRANADKSWTAESISVQLRSSPKSISSRLKSLESKGFAQSEGNNTYKYFPQDPELKSIADELAEVYKIRPHKVFELVFSPLKKAKHFADAFVVSSKSKKGNDNG